MAQIKNHQGGGYHKLAIVVALMMAALLSIGVGQAQAATADGHPDPITSTFEGSSYNRLGGEFGVLSNFGLVSFNNLTLNVHTNSNFATKNLLKSSGFGTGNKAHPEASYIQQHSVGDMNAELGNGSIIVFGPEFNVTYDGSQWHYTDSTGSNCVINTNNSEDKATAIRQDTDSMSFLDFNELEQQAIELNQSYRGEPETTDSNIVTCDIDQTADQNNRAITLGEGMSRAVLNIKAKDLCWSSNQITVYNKSDSTKVLIINVDARDTEKLTIPKFTFDGDGNHELSEWRSANVVFNVYDSSASDGLYRGTIENLDGVTASILAPAATVIASKNIDGQIIAHDITINGEFHRDSFDTSGSIVARKVLDGAELKDGEFSFTLTAENGAPMPAGAKDGSLTVTNAASGAVTFGNIAYSEAGTYRYTIAEVNDGQDGVTYDSSTHDVIVVVKEVGGTLHASVSYDTDGNLISPTFTNTYNKTKPTEASLRLTGSKSITGREFKDGDAFTFVVAPVDNAPAFSDAEVTIRPTFGSTATVNFGSAVYEEEGTYTYTVREKRGSDGAISYDGTVYTVTVTVSPDGNGGLTPYVTYAVDGLPADALSWTNEYTAPAPTAATISIAAQKRYEGGTLGAGQFAFLLTGSDGAPMPDDASGNEARAVNAADGSIAFGEIRYTEAGTYRYTIAEENDGQDGVTYDSAVHTAVVTVTEDNGALHATVVYDGSSSTPPAFTNRYTNEQRVSVSMTGVKTIVGRDFQDGDAFTFTVTPQDGAPAFSNAKATIAPTEGTRAAIDFGTATFTEAGTYRYAVVEQAGDAAGMTYDTAVRTVVITVNAGSDGKLSAEVAYADADGAPLEGLTWQNAYDAEKPKEKVKKKPKDNNGLVQTGDMTPTVVAALIVLGGGAILAGMVTQRKR